MPSLRERLDNGDILIGPMALIGSPIVVEIFGHTGFDLVFIDTEHAPTSPYGTELEAMLRAATAAGLHAIVRPTEPPPRRHPQGPQLRRRRHLARPHPNARRGPGRRRRLPLPP